MRVPCCSLCHSRYDEEERAPLLLHCGHGFCKACLSKMFTASADTSLCCPRCRLPTLVGNSVHALRKNFPILSLLASSASSPSFDYDFTDDDEEGNGQGDEDYDLNDDDYLSHRDGRRGRAGLSSHAGCCSAASASMASTTAIDLGLHHEFKLLRRLGEGRRVGQEVWSAVLSKGSSSSSQNGGSCRHLVAVKRIALTEDTDVVWLKSRLENLRQASMWCRNICTFHGVKQTDGYLCLVMDRFTSSIQSEMLRNKGRLTLEQILRFLSS